MKFHDLATLRFDLNCFLQLDWKRYHNKETKNMYNLE